MGQFCVHSDINGLCVVRLVQIYESLEIVKQNIIECLMQIDRPAICGQADLFCVVSNEKWPF